MTRLDSCVNSWRGLKKSLKPWRSKLRKTSKRCVMIWWREASKSWKPCAKSMRRCLTRWEEMATQTKSTWLTSFARGFKSWRDRSMRWERSSNKKGKASSKLRKKLFRNLKTWWNKPRKTTRRRLTRWKPNTSMRLTIWIRPRPQEFKRSRKTAKRTRSNHFRTWLRNMLRRSV